MATTAIAVFSLFYNFTEDVPQSQRKRLTRAGRYALALIVVSGIASLGATIAKDVMDSRTQAADGKERLRQTEEIRLLSTTFEKIEIKLQLDQPMSWRDKEFLSVATQEEICGAWHHLNKPNGIYADWCVSKSLDEMKTHGLDKISILYVDTRKDVIAEFVRQNYPALSASLPNNLAFYGDLADIENYQSPNVLYFGHSNNNSAEDIRYNVPDTLAAIKFEDEKFDEITFLIATRMSFSQIVGSQIRLAFSLTTADVRDEGTSMWERTPAHNPFVFQHLKSIDVYLNDHLVKQVFEHVNHDIKFQATSEWAQKHNSFTAPLFELTLSHDLIVASQATPASSPEK